MKHLIVSVAGLGWDDVQRRCGGFLAGLRFQPAESVYPAVTCTAQATLRTGLTPREHGMTSNGYYARDLEKPAFWEQSSRLVQGRRIWEDAREAGATVGMFFFQQSFGECVDALLSPAPIHKHGGGMIMAVYGQPGGASEMLERRFGSFPLWQYWGPFASPKVGDKVLGRFLAMQERYDLDISFLYLPTLDYEAQRFGERGARCDRAFARFQNELEQLAALAKAQGAALTVLGEYAIADVTQPPVFPNRTLRRAGLFRTRSVRGRAYPDFAASKAFAMVDHEIAHVYIRDPDDVDFVRDTLLETGDYEQVEARTAGAPWAHPSAGELLLLAKPGSWCAYPWWTARSEAPDWATHIDIHNKPGYDPCELFFDRKIPIPPSTCQDAARILGSHGRVRPVAVASTASTPADTYLETVHRLRDTLA